MRRAAAWAGWTLLAALAAAGVALALLAAIAELPFTRPFVASRLVRVLDEAIAGTVSLKGISVLPRGGIELRGLEVFDPHGHLVLSAGRARFFVDVTSVRARAVGLTAEIESPSILLEEEPGRGFSIARAFEPARRREGEPGAPAPGGGGSPWTVVLTHLAVRGGDFWWVGPTGETRLEASAVDVEARGVAGPGRARVDLRMKGSLDSPVSTPMSLEVAGVVAGGAFRVPALRAELGGTRLEAVAEGDLPERRGRVALVRAGLAREIARAFAPRTPEGDDLSATAYAESDGDVVTVALRAEPSGEGARGRADAAVAVRAFAPAAALGFDAVLDRLDPSRLVADAPAGDVTLSARGAASGRTLSDLRGRLAATVQRSRLRRGEIGRAEIAARADQGTIEVSRAVASGPGLDLDATFRWRSGGDVSGRVAANAKDLGAALANAGALLGRPLARLQGSARVEAALSGTTAAPRATATVDAPAFRAGGLALAGVHLTADAAGPASRPSGRIEGRIEAVRGRAGDVARAVTLRGALADDQGSVAATAALPGFRDPASLEARGRLGPRRESIVVGELSFSYPGSRWQLVSPATVKLSDPSVDRLELVAEPQRIVLAGGLVRGKALDARAELSRVDLARLPAGLVPAAHRLRGALDAELSATGTSARPELSATLRLGGGAVDGLDGLSLAGSARWSGAERRLRASLAASRKDGGVADVDVDLPLPAAGRPGERVVLRARAREVPLEEVLAAAGSDLPAAGLVALDAVVEGPVADPTLSLGATLSEGEWEDLSGLGIDVAAEDPGERLRVSVKASHDGRGAAALDAELPLDVSLLLERPAAAVRAARAAPLEGSLTVRALDLGALAGRAGIPPRLAGTIDGDAQLSGTLAAPRARGSIALARGAWAGYRDLAGAAEVTLSDGETAARGRVAVGGDEAIRFEASLGAPIEKLGARRLGAAPLRAAVTIPRVALARASSVDLPLAGTVEGRITAAGSLRAPELTVTVAGEGLSVEGNALGSARVEARYREARTSGELVLAAASGGTLRSTFALEHDFGLGAPPADLGQAQAEIAVAAEALDLGFLPAAAPRVVRSAAGTLSIDARAKGPLARLAPRGTLKVRDGKLAVTEWGEWNAIAVEATITDDAVEVGRVEVHRGSGKFSASGSLRGLRTDRATLQARVTSESFTVARAGMDVATVDLRGDVTGTYDGSTLAVEMKVPRGVVRLPKRQPRALQPLGTRDDIVVGRRPPERKRRAAPAVTPASAPAQKPFTLRATMAAERNLFVKSDDPRIDIELRANVTYERTGSDDYMDGYVEVVRGSLEPIGGRNFTVERGRVQFTNGPPSAAQLDFQARYENPAAVVTVTVEGPARAPKVRFTSEPQLGEQEIAMLIATGRTDLKAGAGSTSTLSGEEAGKAALGVLATQFFKDLVANKLPVDSVSFDAAGFRAGKYLTDKIYVVYARRFEADPLRGENTDEVRVEYQITPRWMFESRFGNAQSGGANLVWSKEY